METSPVEKLIAFITRVRKPVEWLLLLASVVWLLPPAAKNTLEVTLVTSIFAWTLGGTAVVATIDAIAAGNETGSRQSRLITAHVRLRSLKLIGSAIVAVALILSVSDQLVGRGTIYSWVLSTCWLVALPVVLLIVHWWHDIIHERLATRRRKTALEAWVLAHDRGAARLAAASIGGAALLLRGGHRALRHWLSTFDVSRRVLAYLFRRDMSRRGDATAAPYRPLPAALFESLGPEVSSVEIVPSIADEDVVRAITRINGGVAACSR